MTQFCGPQHNSRLVNIFEESIWSCG